MSELIDVTARYAEVAPLGVKPDLEAIRVEFVRIRDVLAENGWDTRSPAYSNLVAQVEATASQPDSLGARFARIVRAEVESCR